MAIKKKRSKKIGDWYKKYKFAILSSLPSQSCSTIFQTIMWIANSLKFKSLMLTGLIKVVR